MGLSAAVIGGGISGLASTLRLAERGHHVTLFEADAALGGLATTFPYAGTQLEKFYHCMLPTDDALLRIVRDLGLDGDLIWKRTLMGFMVRNETRPLNTALDLLRFSALRLDDRIRLGLLAVAARIGGLSPKLDHITAAEYVERIVGPRAFETIWKPLLSAKIGDQYPALPALWLTSRLYREKSTQKEEKGCLRDGYASLISAFERRLLDSGASIRVNTRVSAFDVREEGTDVLLEDGTREAFDFVVSTSPVPALQKMSEGVAASPAMDRIRALDLDYQGVICGVFLLDRPLSPYYWTAFVDSGATSQGVIEMSNLVPIDRADGLYVTYFVNYCHRDDPMFQLPDGELLERYRKDLSNLFPEAGPRVADQFLFRAPFVEPIWSLGYSERKPATTLVPGRLYASTTAHLYPRVTSWNSCCEIVEEMLVELDAHVAGLSPRSDASR